MFAEKGECLGHSDLRDSLDCLIQTGSYSNRLVMVTWSICSLTQEHLSSGFANNKCAEQPAHPRRLPNAFIIRLLESTISKLATAKISIF